jgi:glyceraldehyde-3-phosphate dehydrogenase/erythrose-4-phosphate dehydrogenase
MTHKIRIGRTVLRAAMTRDDVEIVANEDQGGG